MLQHLLLLTAAVSPVQTASDAVPVPSPGPTADLPVGHTHPEQHLVRIHGDRGAHLLRLGALDLDVLRSSYARGYVEAIVTDAELEAIEDLGLTPEIVQRDLARYYAQRLTAGAQNRARGTVGQWLQPAFGAGGMGGYYTLAEIEGVLDQMAAAYPQFVSPKTSIGTSHGGRDLWMVRVSDNPNVDENEPEVRYDALHHAREPEGMQATLYFVSWLLESYGTDPVATYILEERELYVVPCVNPDGYEHNRSIAPSGGGLWRKNRRNNGNGTFGVDLNRNYPFQWAVSGSSANTSSEIYHGPSAGSEPETQAMVQFLAARTFETSLSVHTYSDLWLSPWGYVPQYPPDWSEIAEIGALATEVNGYPHGPAAILLYEAAGATDDYDYGVHGTYSWTPELGGDSDGFWPPQSRIEPIAEENRLAFARTALAAGGWLRPADLTATDTGNGNGVFEPGEGVTLDVQVRNSGRGAASGTSTLSTSSAFATVVQASAAVSAAPFTDGANSTPLSLAIAPGTPNGTVIPLSITVADGALETVLETSIVVGEFTVASFDFEAAGNQGWTVDAPNDASTGTWTRVDPVGTAAAPEDDHTPGAGTLCWVTGQGVVGGALGANDVDGGSTALWSPVFDLSGTAEARLRYARWYSNDAGASPNADVFQVDVSNDGGATWTAAEVVGPTGAGTSGGWIEAEIDLGALLAPTATMRVRFVASDLGSGSIVEAALDDVEIRAITDTSCPAPVNYCVAAPNAAGPGALLAAFGSQDVSHNTFGLQASGVPPLQFGLFFHGQGQTDVPLGNGHYCIPGTVVRMPVVQADGFGIALFPVDFGTHAPTIANGQTWSFQYWYRDIGGAGYNFSDAVEVTFCAGG